MYKLRISRKLYNRVVALAENYFDHEDATPIGDQVEVAVSDATFERVYDYGMDFEDALTNILDATGARS